MKLINLMKHETKLEEKINYYLKMFSFTLLLKINELKKSKEVEISYNFS